ncbi:GIY-YIG nuclease family protein [Winogradskyella schleiferi]|uniref:GIY-YIG nuclease family protein n=1 Tax=Winogradskyella schleiferi TaxID=2686078 RepID=UPI0015C0BCDC|nr:GIY-YIG nuclease family protein [Winogradskyella schleiferi]
MSKVNAAHNYYVYNITNKNKTVLYIGVTNNLADRLFYHNNPEAHSKSFSHKYKCKHLIYCEHFSNVESAIDREKQLKKWNRTKKEFLINLKNPNCDFLNSTI